MSAAKGPTDRPLITILMGADMYREPLGPEVMIAYGLIALISGAIGFVIGLLF